MQFDLLCEALPDRSPSEVYGAEHLLRFYGGSPIPLCEVCVYIYICVCVKSLTMMQCNAALVTACILSSPPIPLFLSHSVRLPKLLSNVFMPDSDLNPILSSLNDLLK